jgi:DNA-binding transcriptional regulator GbsR (MarR family)
MPIGEEIFNDFKKRGQYKDYPTYEDFCARNETTEQREVREKSEAHKRWKESRPAEEIEQYNFAFIEEKYRDLKLEEKWDATH